LGTNNEHGTERRIALAYDGSIHGDWVGRYALRLARAAGSPLEVVHVDDGALPSAALETRLNRLRDMAAASGVDLSARELGSTGDVAGAIDAAFPADDGTLVVCGLRARESGRGLLRGTVSEALLSRGRHDVLAVRVVSPSLLGHARHVLFCVSGTPESAAAAGPFLELLAPELTRLSLLTVVSHPFERVSRPTAGDLRRLHARGTHFLQQVEAELESALGSFEIPFDPHVSISRDWPAEITRQAGRARAELVMLGATEHTLTRRLFGNPLESVLRDAVCDIAIFRLARARRA
jgi:nucleotide-binding universal stress UspA family protein